MNPLLTLIATLSELKNNIRTRFNAVIKDLGPIEQVEASDQIISVLREVDWASHRIASISESIDETIAKVAEGVSHMRDLSPIWEMYKEGIDIDAIEWSEH